MKIILANFILGISLTFDTLSNNFFTVNWQSNRNTIAQKEEEGIDFGHKIERQLGKGFGRILFGMPVKVDHYFAGQYQSPVMRIELGENYDNLNNDPNYKVSKKGKVRVKPIKVKDVFKVSSPKLKIKDKDRSIRLKLDI